MTFELERLSSSAVINAEIPNRMMTLLVVLKIISNPHSSRLTGMKKLENGQ
ncbi:hypothetical protein [Nostoc sp. WHI]|uniref:hypothetical protein n=1 Tax=Nostoc sp. WHI TaxID=2650611 RepID=UPI0018C5E36F|nr:hypothetical protein [Nostoc sp. WHI]